MYTYIYKYTHTYRWYVTRHFLFQHLPPPSQTKNDSRDHVGVSHVLPKDPLLFKEQHESENLNPTPGTKASALYNPDMALRRRARNVMDRCMAR